MERGETEEGREQRDPRNQQGDNAGDRRGERGTPETGELETPTEREERNREEETLQSEGGTVRHRGPWGP